MGGPGVACKFLGIFLILSLLLQGTCTAQASNEANANYTINDTVNGTIIGTVNGTINGTISDTVNNTTVNGTVVGTVVGTVNGTINGTIISTRSKSGPLEWVLILPVLAGYLLFLCWMCRFFDRMNFCFVVFILIMLIVLLLRFMPLDLGPAAKRVIFIVVLLLLVIMLLLILTPAMLHEVFPPKKKKNQENESNPVMILHDMLRNFIIIFSTLLWPLLFIYLHMNDIESATFYGIEDVEFPIIIAASSIGVLSYLLLSIEEIFSQLIPEYKKMSIAWSYLRRILIAPFIALIIVYILPFSKPDDTTLTDELSVFFFSFFAGFFTKPVEEWIYVGVQKFLPDVSKEEFKSRNEKYDVKESDFVKMLGISEDLAYMLYYAKIRTIEELARCDVKEIKKKVNLDTRNIGEGVWCPVKGQEDRLGSYSDQQIQLAIDKARETLGIDKSKLVRVLKMDKELASKLYNFVNIKTIEDLSTLNEEYIYKKLSACNQGANKEKIKEYINSAIEYTGMNESGFVKDLDMEKDLAFKISHFTGIKSVEALSTSDADDVHNKLGVCKEDISKAEIKEYIEKAIEKTKETAKET
ncbi:hypothetical protein RSJ42_07495 [Methanosarcina hadiensis]|uniref:hypothetical protein n=1 Tax=Methanosarcina hadiensis TaxID=3078083 RepID=UPI0039779784